MTRLIDSLTERPAPQRITLAIVLTLVGLFLAGMAAGVVVAMIEKGMPSRPWVAAIPFIAAPLAFFALKYGWRLAVPPQSASAYEKRYWRAFLMIAILGMPFGAALAIASGNDGLSAVNPFLDGPIAPGAAVALAVGAVCLFALTIVIYHRAIDDHEERAYLWGSQIAYYFLIVAFPVWWLLQRGGLVAPIDTASAFGAIIVSFFVQGAVWAWLKFR